MPAIRNPSVLYVKYLVKLARITPRALQSLMAKMMDGRVHSTNQSGLQSAGVQYCKTVCYKHYCKAIISRAEFYFNY